MRSKRTISGAPTALCSPSRFEIGTDAIVVEDAILHNKVGPPDARTVITGCFNFSKAAEERNAENLLVIRDPVLAAKYASNFERHRQHAEPYQRLAPQ